MALPAKRITFFTFCAALLFVTAAAHGAEILRYAGATTLQRDFMPEAAHLFEAQNGVKFRIEGGNTDAGLNALRAGMVDIAGSGRFLTAREKAEGFVEHLIGWDALVVVVHATNPVENISLDDLRRLVTGEIRNWRQVGGRDLPVLQVTAPPGSGIHDSVERLILGDERHVATQAIISLVAGDADRNVAQLPAAFTVTSLSMVDARDIKTIAVNETAPNSTNVAAADYPLIKPLLLVTKGPPREKIALFIAFASSPKGQMILRKKFFPLRRS